MTADATPATVLTCLLDAVGCLEERASVSALSAAAEEVKEAAERTQPHDSPPPPPPPDTCSRILRDSHTGRLCVPFGRRAQGLAGHHGLHVDLP